MTSEGFHQIFDQLTDPVLLRAEDGWRLNPAAQALCLSEASLRQLEEWGGDAFLWLSLRFYHVSVQRVDDQPLFFLRPDVFLAEAAENVSSQLRQRLQSAFGCTADLSQIGAVRSDLRARDRLAGVNRELYQIFRLVQELELSSQPDAVLCHPECFDLAAVFLETADELRELFRPAGVELKLEVEPNELFLTADPEKLKFLVLSLVSNSLAHLPKSGGRVTLGLKEQNGQAVISVSDNGTGFSADLLSHPLWSEPRRLVFGRGLGLGLPLVQRVAAAHEGTVMAFPSPKGSKVTVSIPIHIPTDVLAEPFTPIRGASGFSMAKVLLSNALPHSLYYPNPEGDE